VSEALRESFDWLRRVAPSVALQRIVLPTLTHSDIGELQKSSAQPALRKVFLLRACGVVYLALLEESEDASAKERLTSAVLEVFSWAERKRGSATLLRAPVWLKEKVNVWGRVRPDFALMQRVKHAFDPCELKISVARLPGASWEASEPWRRRKLSLAKYLFTKIFRAACIAGCASTTALPTACGNWKRIRRAAASARCFSSSRESFLFWRGS
jgi:hypothetical protein